MKYELHKGEALAMLQRLPDSTIDAVITDPPYSSGGAYRGDRMQRTTSKYVNNDTALLREDFGGDNRDQRSWGYWAALWLSECLRATRSGGIIIMFADWRQLPMATDTLQAGGWVWRGIAVWDKTEGARPQPGRFRAQAEFLLWGSKGPMPTTRAAPALPGVFKYPVRLDEKKLHITAKPIELLRKLVALVPRNGLILDPFCGSGTTGQAALEAGHRFIGCDLSAYNIKQTERRLRAIAEQQTIFTENP